MEIGEVVRVSGRREREKAGRRGEWMVDWKDHEAAAWCVGEIDR